MAEAETTLLHQPEVITIESDRLQLTTLQMSDLDGIMPIITRTEVMQWTRQGPVVNKHQGERWLSDRALGQDVLNFAVRERSSIDARIVGIMGSFHRPTCGYLIHPDYKGKGYATEALKALISVYFERVPAASEGGTGYDVLEAGVDSENFASQRVLEKCGFEIVETRLGEIENTMGLRDTYFYRLPRPGKTLEELGLDAKSVMKPPEDGPEPPIQ